MPVPVQIFLLVFTLAMAALPVLALRANRDEVLDDTPLVLAWVPLATWLVTPIVVLMSGRTPPSRATSMLVAAILLGGMAAAVAVAVTKGAPRGVKAVAWACALGLLLRAAFAIVSAMLLLPA